MLLFLYVARSDYEKLNALRPTTPPEMGRIRVHKANVQAPQATQAGLLCSL